MAKAQQPKSTLKTVAGWRLETDPDRSALMARVRQKGTTPELAVQELLRKLGHNFEVNATHLPGSPDIVDEPNRRVVFIHGCFWHRHRRCAACTTPKRNAAFWRTKFAQNVARDVRKVRQLRRRGYAVLTIWECQVKSSSKLARLEKRLEAFFTAETK